MKRLRDTDRRQLRVISEQLCGLLLALILALCMALALESCHSHKRAIESERRDSVATRVIHLDSVRVIHITDTIVRHWRADSVLWCITADSVARPDGTVMYRPTLTAGLYQPQSDYKQHQDYNGYSEHHEGDSTTTAANEQRDSATTSEREAIAKPPDGDGLCWVIGISIALAALLAWARLRHYNRSRNKEANN